MGTVPWSAKTRTHRGEAADGGADAPRSRHEERDNECSCVGEQVGVQPHGLEVRDDDVEEFDRRLLKKNLIALTGT